MRAAPSAREAAVRGWWFGAGFLLAALYWLAPEIGPGLLLVADRGRRRCGPASPSRPGRCCARRSALPRALAALIVLPSYWLVIEWIRSWQALGGPWAVLGVSQWQHPALLALAAVGGVWLVSFAIVAANTGIVIVLVSGRIRLRVLGAVATAVVIAAGPVAFALTPAAPVAGHVTIALVQAGVQPARSHQPDASLRLTEAFARSGGARGDHPDLIVWGESSVGFNLGTDPGALARIEALSARMHAEILVNQDSYHGGKHTKVAVPCRSARDPRRVRQDAAGAIRRVHPVPRPAVLAHLDQQGRDGEHDARHRRAQPGSEPAGRPAADHRGADLLRVRVPRHVAGWMPTTARR